MSDTVCFAGFLILSTVVMIVLSIRQRVFLKGILFSAVTGLTALLVVSLLGIPLHLGISLNPLSASVAAIYGLPGVIGLLALRLLIL